MKTRFILGLCCLAYLFQTTTALGQSNEVITFKAQFFHQDQLHLSPPISGRVEGSSFRTDSNGEINIDIAVSAPQLEVRMTLLNQDWQIVFPDNGMIPLPRSQDFKVKIFIAKREESNRQAELIQEFRKVRAQLSDQQDNLQAVLNSFGASQLNELDKKMLSAINEQMLLYEQIKAERDLIKAENDRKAELLEEEKKISQNKGRLEARNLLNAVMDHYISRSLDLKDVFQFKGKKVFQRDWIIAEIKASMEAYSEAYEGLNKNRHTILNLVETHWPEDYPKISETRQLLQYALDDLHKTTVLGAIPLLENINEFNQGKGKNKRRKADLMEDIDKLVYELSLKINTLTDRKSEVFQLLEQQ